MALAGDRLDKALVDLAYAADELDMYRCSTTYRYAVKVKLEDTIYYEKFRLKLEEWREANLEWQEDTWNNQPLHKGT